MKFTGGLDPLITVSIKRLFQLELIHMVFYLFFPVNNYKAIKDEHCRVVIKQF